MRILAVISVITLFTLSMVNGFNVFKKTFDEKVVKEYSFSHGSLVLDTVAGSVKIDHWPQNKLQVTIIKKASSEKLLKEIATKIVVNNNHANLVTISQPSNTSADYYIQLPQDTKLEKVAAKAGAIEIIDAIDSVDAVNSAGTIYLKQKTLPKTAAINLEVKAGTITLVLPKESNSTLKATTNVGSITSSRKEINVQSKFPYISYNATGIIGTGDTLVTLKVSTGAIAIV